MLKKKKAFDKYWHYLHSVQSPKHDVKFIQKCYQQLSNKQPRIFREDFSFTFAISCEWVRLNKKYKSIAVDWDPEPLEYGKKHYLSKLNLQQRKYIEVICSNVLNKNLPSADIIAALNFSYFSFKSRIEMKNYFSNCFKSLRSKGILVLDCFGGSDCLSANEEIENCGDFTYYWDQTNFDPISHHSLFYIHYKRKGERKRKKVFTYDWRLWTIPELKEILHSVGFRRVNVYWEGTRRDGSGNGRFIPSKKGEACEAWIAYIISEK